MTEHDVLSAARVVAARWLAEAVDDFSADGWGACIPEASGRGFLRVVEAMALAIPAAPTGDEYEAALDFLARDADDDEQERP